MNSLGNTVLRKGGRKGASGGEQGQGKDAFTSGREANASADSGKKKRKDKQNTRGSEVSMEDAFAALRATREPFISDESVIAGVDDATVKFDSSSSSEVEIIMEELPPTRVPSGTLIGHRGWVAGGDPVDENEEDAVAVKYEGEQTAGSAKASEAASQAGHAVGSRKERGAGRARAKKGRQRDEFALSESEHEAGGSGNDEDPGGGLGGQESECYCQGEEENEGRKSCRR